MDNITHILKCFFEAKAKNNKIIFVSKSEYDEIVNKLGYVPQNLEINAFVPDRKAYVVDQNELNKMSNPTGLKKF